jgi:starch phosphorylase
LFNPEDPGRYQAIYDVLVNWGDHYLLLADFASYVKTQARVDAAYQDSKGWARMAVNNIAGMGPFSSDRTIAEYADNIWHAKGVKV